MKFVLVNDRALKNGYCAMCCEAIRAEYLRASRRDLATATTIAIPSIAKVLGTPFGGRCEVHPWRVGGFDAHEVKSTILRPH